MKILMISSYLPYPLYSGGQVRLYNLIKELSGKHEITLICEKRVNQTEEDIKAVEKICSKVIAVERRKQWSVGNVLKSASSAHSFLVTGHTHDLMKQKISEMLAKEYYDLIHVETYYVMQNLPDVAIPIVLVEQNIEYKVYEKFLQRAPVFLRPFLAVDILKIRREEESCWKIVEALVAVSRDDQIVMEKIGSKPSLVANGVNTEKFAFKEISDSDKTATDKERKILFIGDFKWIQNKDSAKFIIQDIWPKLESRMDAKLWIVARSIPESIRSLTSNTNILFDEESSAKSTEEIFQEASVLLAPIRVGGGTSYKILESMSCGTPVVTMQLSADALEATNGEQLMVGTTAEELAEKTVALLTDTELYKRIGKNGRTFVEKRYTWKSIAKNLEAVYDAVIKKG